MSGPNATDAAKNLARQNDIDLGQVTGTGADGNITKGDVEKAIAAKQTPADKAKATPDTAAAAGDPGETQAQPDPDAPAPADDLEQIEEEADVVHGDLQSEFDAARAEAQEELEPTESYAAGDVRDIERVSDVENGAWWCPFCGHSQTPEYSECQGCGAEYLGDGEVKAVKDSA